MSSPTELFSDYEVNIVDHDDPITKGIRDFRVNSEWYYLLIDPSNEVLATTTVPLGKFMRSTRAVIVQSDRECVMPTVWKRQFGEGRVFYTALGHRMEDFDILAVREIVKRGMLWASR